MLDAMNLAVTSLVSHGLQDKETEREMALDISSVLINQPSHVTVAQKQLALIRALEGLVKTYPAEYQASSLMAIITTLLLGVDAFTAAVKNEMDFADEDA